MPRRKFIDRKNAVTFNLVHRSQRDPLVADEAAPQRVLVPVNAVVPPSKDKQPELTKEQRKVVQQKYGIYFDDDYNYLQHLRDTKEVTMLLQPNTSHKRKAKTEEDSNEKKQKSAIENLQLPSSVFASEVEEDIGLLNKAAPQGLRLDLDPDVVAAMDEDFNFEDPQNELEDNFMELAMAQGSDDEDDDQSEDGSERSFASDHEYADDADSEDSQRGRRMPAWDQPEETRSRFSQYSMSSSVMRRNAGLETLDHRFEKMFAEYDDTEIGALDCEEIEGHVPHTDRSLLAAAEEEETRNRRYQLDREKEIARLVKMQEIAEESESDLVAVPVNEEDKWDCETILSTYSNLYNHPKLIDEPRKPQKIKINAKTGIPVESLTNPNKLTVKNLLRFNAEREKPDDDAATQAESVLTTLSVLSIRGKDETPEEKRERKKLLKEYRKERRIERKANSEAFKEEKKRQEKIMMNNRKNVQGNRIL